MSPLFKREIDHLLNELREFRKSFLVTPLWAGANRFDAGFAGMLGGQELALHGLTHISGKNDRRGKLLLMSGISLKEFYGLSEEETRARIATAREMFQEIFHRSPAGFIPPMWHHNKHTLKILKEMGFCYTESAWEFLDLRRGRRMRSIPVCFDYGKNKLLNALSVKIWKYGLRHLRQPVVRISVHPSDAKNACPAIADLLKWHQDKGSSFHTYEELIHL